MRLWSVCSVVMVLAFVNLAPSFAVAHCRHHHHHHHHCFRHRYLYHHYRMRSVYSTCACHFGYGNVCAPAVSCSAEGGRCAGSCVHHPQSEYLSTPMTPAPAATSGATVEVAKKCQDLTAKAYPPLVAGNPAAGSANGMVETKEVYYSNCIAVYR
jgi:hypothetical protein